MTISFALPLWYDLHTHLRQDALLPHTIKAQLDMGCCGVLAMPNTKPPVGKALKNDPLPYWSIEEYLEMINAHGGAAFKDVIVPLYLTKDTTAQMIEQGAKAGVLRAAKYYPPHGTTGADFGVPLVDILQTDVFRAMQDNNVVLNVHGEEHHMKGCDYFDRTKNAEEVFYTQRLPRVRDAYPDLKIACEHVTTATAVHFVQQSGKNTAATITPQHLLYTVGDLLQGLKYHLYCLPLLKFTEDRDALRKAATSATNTQFFAGTDSAPHTKKVTECGCAAGCFTGGIAPQLYAQAFEEAGLDLALLENQALFAQFLCHIGARFYGLETPEQTFTLTKSVQGVGRIATDEGDIIPLPVGLGQNEIGWRIG